MKATVYKQAYDNPICTLEVTDEDIERGWAWHDCLDCDGTGRFPMPEPGRTEACVACKATGRRPVSVI